MTSRGVIQALVAGAVVLLAAAAVTGGLAALLTQTGDLAAGRVVGYILVAELVLLTVDLICLLLALGWDAGSRPDDPPSSRS